MAGPIQVTQLRAGAYIIRRVQGVGPPGPSVGSIGAVMGLQAALDAKANNSDLPGYLNAKANSGANADITSLSALTTPLAISMGGTGATTANGAVANLGLNTIIPNARNLIINSNFFANPRQLSGTITLGAGGRGPACWKAGSGGCTYTISTSGIDTVINISAGSLLQIVDPVDVEGGNYALSQAGTAQMRAGISGAAPTGAYAAGPRYYTTAGVGQTITVEFSTGTVSLAKLEPGTVATAYVRRHRYEEQTEVERHVRVIGRAVAMFASTTTAVEAAFQHYPPMRAPPVLSINGSAVSVIRGSNGSTISLGFGPTIDASQTVNGGRYAFNISAGALVQGEALVSVTDNFLFLTAEL